MQETECPLALNDRAVALHRCGQLQAAEAAYRQALRLDPYNPQIQLNLAALHAALGQTIQALALTQLILTASPDSSHAHTLASVLQTELCNYPAALDHAELALAHAPTDPKLRVRIGWLLWRLDRAREALDTCDLVLETHPSNAVAHHVRALALQALDRTEDALQSFQAALTLSAEPAAILTDKAWLLAELGRTPEARENLSRALSLQPELTAAWQCKASITRYAADDPDLMTMQTLMAKPALPDADRMRLAFALGRAWLDLGDGDRAFAHLDLGNRLKRETIFYSADAEARLSQKVIATFSREIMARQAGLGNPSAQPIFVFGMPRSGTTLVEQILASHPLVHGIGEPQYLPDIARRPNLLEGIANAPESALHALGTAYLDRAVSGVPAGKHLADKMTGNFLHAGLISLILPNARMIHCRRDAMDTCLSCYSLMFTSGHHYSYDLAELGRFYCLYMDVMEHWRRVLPPASRIEVDYESLVADPEPEIRRLLDFCGLPWDSACLMFHETRRRVTSASFDQVRSPIYRHAVGRGQRFGPWLTAIRDSLSASRLSAAYPARLPSAGL